IGELSLHDAQFQTIFSLDSISKDRDKLNIRLYTLGSLCDERKMQDTHKIDVKKWLSSEGEVIWIEIEPDPDVTQPSCPFVENLGYDDTSKVKVYQDL